MIRDGQSLIVQKSFTKQVICRQVSAHMLGVLTNLSLENKSVIQWQINLLFICLIKYGLTIDRRCHCITALFSDKNRVSRLSAGAQLKIRLRQKIKISLAVVIWFVY